MKKNKVDIQHQNDYSNFLEEIKNTISKSKLRVVRTVNKQLISLYWSIGLIIVSRQSEFKWGKSVVERLANDLHYEFPDIKGFSARNLWDMRRFYMAYKDDKFLRQVVAEIPWSHNLLILNMVKSVQERVYYVQAVKKMGWTRNVLLNQIKADAYKRHKQMPKTHNFPKALSVHLAAQADETIKSEYNLEFLGIARPVLEKELEKRLIEKIKQFILELGYGFTFIGNQYSLRISDKEYFIDLLFFNRKLRSLVAIELKTGEFKPEYAGKMDFYLHLLDEKVKLEDENPSIGIILCAKKDNIIVEYALKSTKKTGWCCRILFDKEIAKRVKRETA